MPQLKFSMYQCYRPLIAQRFFPRHLLWVGTSRSSHTRPECSVPDKCFFLISGQIHNPLFYLGKMGSTKRIHLHCRKDQNRTSNIMSLRYTGKKMNPAEEKQMASRNSCLDQLRSPVPITVFSGILNFATMSAIQASNKFFQAHLTRIKHTDNSLLSLHKGQACFRNEEISLKTDFCQNLFFKI